MSADRHENKKNPAMHPRGPDRGAPCGTRLPACCGASGGDPTNRGCVIAPGSTAPDFAVAATPEIAAVVAPRASTKGGLRASRPMEATRVDLVMGAP